MDKYEYKVRSEEIKSLIAKKEYAEAVKIADTIDWRRVRSVMMLCTISDLYKINRRLEDSKNILLMAYDRHPGGRTIIYSLCELCIKTEDIVGAIEYYKEFVQVAPRDTGRFILQYKLYEAQDVSLEERIAVLEEFKKRDYREKWAYELAYLYHRIGLATKCVEECDDLILWFGEGKYVIKAMELKMLHEPLTPDQQAKYNNRFVKNVEGTMTRVLPTVQIQEALQQTEQQLSKTQEILEAPTQRLPLEDIDIQVKMVDVGQYDTINMQKELAESIQEILPPGQEITPETGIIQPEKIEAEMMRQPIGQPEEMIQSELEEAQPEEQIPEGVEAWEKASPAFTFYENNPEQLAHDLEEAWGKAESAAFTFYDPKTGQTAQITPDDQEKLLEELSAWNQVKSAAFTFYDFKGLAKKIEEEQQQEQITQAIVAPLLQETTDMSEVSEQMNREIPAGGMTEVFFGETGEIGDIGINMETSEEPETAEVIEEDRTSQIVMDQIKEDVLAAKNGMYKPETEVISPQALPSQPLDKILSMEYDGQLSMVMPDTERVEKQITGQMSIEDILAEWERMKKASEEKCMENVRQRVLQQTGDMFAEFDEAAKSGLLEQLEGLAESAEQKEDTEEVQDDTGVEEVFFQDEEDVIEEPEVDEVEEIGECEEDTVAEEDVTEVDEISDSDEAIETEYTEPVENIEEVQEDAGVEEVFFQDAPETDTEELVEESVEEVVEETVEEPAEEEIAEEIPQILTEPATVETGEEVFFQEESVDDEESEEDGDAEEELGNFFANRGEEAELEEDASKVVEAGAEVYFSDATEDKTEEEVPEEEENSKEEENSEEGPEKPKVRDFTKEERELFASFVQDRASKEQLIQTLENISLASFTGNVIITGEETETTLALARNLVKNFQMSDSNFSGKIAKISGEGLNKKQDIVDTISKVENGALLIQNAGGMNEETVKRLTKALEQDNRGVIVVLEDTKKSISRLIEKNEILKNTFNCRVDIKAMDNDSLVEFAKKYAYEKEYSIDEMGVLALHTRIADMQTLDHAVTVAEVREIMDEAIESANKKSISHFFDVVLSKRYDEEDMIVLREKDFI